MMLTFALSHLLWNGLFYRSSGLKLTNSEEKEWCFKFKIEDLPMYMCMHPLLLFLEHPVKMSQELICLDLCVFDKWTPYCAAGKRICAWPHPAAAWDSLEKWLYMDIQKWGQGLWQSHVRCCLECIQWFPKSYAAASKAFRETVFVRKLKW